MSVRTPSTQAEGGVTADLTESEWEVLRALVHETTGIALGEGKRVMLASRLHRRVRALKLSSFGEYHALLSSRAVPAGEWQAFVNCVTTNKTDFYREAHHFDLLGRWAASEAPAIVQARDRGLRIWSAACSSGEEPYTIAHTLRRALPSSAWSRVRILATDIDTEVLAKARSGLYDIDRVNSLTSEQRNGLVQRVAGTASQVEVVADLADAIRFERLNFLDDRWPVRGGLDVIFCRNALIYFNAAGQRRIIERFISMLAPHGLLFLGHAENLHWLTDRLESLGNTAYRLRGQPRAHAVAPPAQPVSAAKAPPLPATRRSAPSTAVRPIWTAGRPQNTRRVEIGDVAVGRGTEWASATLGSCVSLCLFDPEAGVGAMNHVLLPGDERSDDTRYGTRSYEELLERVCAAGAVRRRLQAKLVGGAIASRLGQSAIRVAAANIAQAHQWLTAEAIPLVSERKANAQGVEIHFQFGTGVLLVRPLALASASTRLSAHGARL